MFPQPPEIHRTRPDLSSADLSYSISFHRHAYSAHFPRRSMSRSLPVPVSPVRSSGSDPKQRQETEAYRPAQPPHQAPASYKWGSHHSARQTDGSPSDLLSASSDPVLLSLPEAVPAFQAARHSHLCYRQNAQASLLCFLRNLSLQTDLPDSSHIFPYNLRTIHCSRKVSVLKRASGSPVPTFHDPTKID